MSTRACPQCGLSQPDLKGCFWQDVWYCSRVCSHAAGDRTACRQGCGCTAYARKRRCLRDHREQMRIMDEVIVNHGLDEEVEDVLVEKTGNTCYWLGWDKGPDGMDESSDEEDPEANALQLVEDLHQEAADRRAFVSMVAGALECRGVVTDLEQARMRLEDLRALGLA